MEDNTNTGKDNSSNLISRNTPMAFIVGVAGFLGSFIAEELIKKNIQVIGIDDFSSGSRKNLDNLTAEKNFHFINSSILDAKALKDLILPLPRFDYAFFVAEDGSTDLYKDGLLNFLHIIREFKDQQPDSRSDLSKGKPKIIYTSSLNLYDTKLNSQDKLIKDGEIKFAKFIKYYKLHGRIVRLSALFGPRMNFRDSDPAVRLINAALTNSLQSENITSDFSTRALYISDAVDLIVKATLSGGTSQHIYDGARNVPVKVEELKQILLDPLWHESKGFKETELPPWNSPNLKKTMKDLNWKAKAPLLKSLKETISYFKDNDIKVDKKEDVAEIPQPKKEEKEEVVDLSSKTTKKWSFYSQIDSDESTAVEVDELSRSQKPNQGSSWRSKIFLVIILAIIGYGLILPVISLGVGALTIRGHISASKVALENGDFVKAEKEIVNARTTLNDAKVLLEGSQLIARTGVFEKQITALNTTVLVSDNALDGIAHAVKGGSDLFQTTKIIVGNETGDTTKLFDNSQTELDLSLQKLSKAEADLKNPEVINNLPSFLKPRVQDLSIKVGVYKDMVEKMRTASILLPELTATSGGKKSYLVLFQNNLELRPTGGFIGSYGILSFENGKLTNIKVDDIYNLDGGLSEVIEPPLELKSDMGLQRLFLRDANFEADFPTSAKVLETMYKKESGQSVNGVITMDLAAAGKLLDGVGGVELSEYNEKVDSSNLFEKAITHAEVNFFPGSQAKKNYLTALQTQLFNKMFYLSKQNWPSIIQALGESLEQKHVLVYLSDSKLFSYLSSENWTGVVSRGGETSEGEFNDFLAVNESNMGANKANYYLDRKFRLDTSIGKEGQVYHVLAINYKNNSPSEVFPAGIYKDRFKIYLPLGAKLTKAVWGERDITGNFSTFSDYGRTGYSTYIALSPKEQKTLVLEYHLENSLTFKNDQSEYQLTVLKQPGTGSDPFEWNLTYPINLKADSNSITNSDTQELNITTDLLVDRSFLVHFSKK